MSKTQNRQKPQLRTFRNQPTRTWAAFLRIHEAARHRWKRFTMMFDTRLIFAIINVRFDRSYHRN
jgi:hypothetical protein